MKAPVQVGVTGGIGSGKSLVCRIFECLGVKVYDADRQAKRVMTSDPELVIQIKKEFGSTSYFPDGSLNRHYLATTVFAAKDKVEKLNRLVHPRVRIDYAQWVVGHADQNYLIKEAALLVEAGTSLELDKIIVVTAPEPLRIKRVVKRDPERTAEEVLHIIRNQLSEDEKINHADFIIVNDESKLLIPQVLELHQRFMSYSS